MALMKYVSLGGRFDRVQPNLDDDSDAYTAISPRLYFRTTWQTKEYIIMNYTHYFLGDRAFPGSPYSEEFKADADMVSLTAIMSF
jgi:hypothetical protein